jgi:hypothetical protein
VFTDVAELLAASIIRAENFLNVNLEKIFYLRVPHTVLINKYK